MLGGTGALVGLSCAGGKLVRTAPQIARVIEVTSNGAAVR